MPVLALVPVLAAQDARPLGEVMQGVLADVQGRMDGLNVSMPDALRRLNLTAAAVMLEGLKEVRRGAHMCAQDDGDGGDDDDGGALQTLPAAGVFHVRRVP